MLSVLLILVLVYLTFVFAPTKILDYSERGIGVTHGAAAAATFFQTEGLKGPIFNNANSGSYLIYYLYPQEQVFVDNRFADSYPGSFFDDTYFPMINDESSWQTLSAQYNINTIFFFHYWASLQERTFLNRRINDPDWALVYADSYNVILVRNTLANQAVIKKFQITKDNAAQRLDSLIHSSNVDDQIAAGDILNMIGLQDLALSQYFRVVTQWPQRGQVWLIMGEMETAKNTPNDSVLALMFLDKAITEGTATAETYSYLGTAYSQLVQTDQAIQALQKSLSIDPTRTDAKKLLDTIQSQQ